LGWGSAVVFAGALYYGRIGEVEVSAVSLAVFSVVTAAFPQGTAVAFWVLLRERRREREGRAVE
jgi:hypothetical protein